MSNRFDGVLINLATNTHKLYEKYGAISVIGSKGEFRIQIGTKEQFFKHAGFSDITIDTTKFEHYIEYSFEAYGIRINYLEPREEVNDA